MIPEMTSSLNRLPPTFAREAGTPGARRATGVPASDSAPPDAEVVATSKRRRFSGAERRRIVLAAERCTQRGELGALLRREGIYSSMLATWRKQHAAAERVALAPQKRGPKPNLAARQIKQLNRDVARLRAKLVRAEIIIDAQKKLCVALGLPTAEELSEDE